MTIGEKAAYIKGLAEGRDLGLNEDGKKVFDAIIDLLGEMADVVTECDEDLTSLYEDVSAVGEDLDALSADVDDVYDFLEECCDDDDDDDFFDEDECCHHHHHHHHCDCGCEDDDDFDDDCFYDVTCPVCHETIRVAEETLLTGGIVCPSCGESLEFDFDDDDCDCEDCCGCEED